MNIVPIDNAAPAPGSMLEHALRYAAIGWHVFPVWGGADEKCKCRRMCKSPGKHPVEHIVPRGQDDATTDPAKIRRWWAQMPDAGIGCVMRPSGLVAIDIDPRNGGFESIDDIEVRHGPLASDVMQFTQGGGEHRLFKLAADLNISLPGKLGKGIDVKRNGYIVLAPTKGIAGTYDWEGSSDPTDGNIPSPLPDWLRGLSQNHQDQAVETTVASRHVTEAQVGELRDALAVLSSDDRDRWVSFGMALRPLGQVGFDLWAEWSKRSEKFDPVDQIRVWRSFRPGRVNYESIFFAAQEAGWINPLSAGAPPPAEVVMAERPQPRAIQRDDAQNFPTEFPVPILNRIMVWMEGFSEEPNRIITMQGVLALASVLSGRIYESENGNVGSMYFLTLSPTGTGKGYPKDAIRRMLSESGMENLLSGSGNTSAGAVFSALFKAPTHIQISDEFGKHLQIARKQINGAMADAFAVLVEAYSDANGMLVPRNYSNFHLTKREISALDSKIVKRPAITLYAFATPEQVLDNLSTAEIDDGFLNRLVSVDVRSGFLPEQRIRSKAVPAEFVEFVKKVRRVGQPPAGSTSMVGMDTDYDMAPTPVHVSFSHQAWEAFNVFKAEIKAKEWLEPRLTMRWRENAMRLATMLAVAENPEAPAVSIGLTQWAINYIRSHGEAFMQSAASKIADSDFHRLYLQIKQLLIEAGPAGVSERELSVKCRLFRRTPPHLRDQVFSALVRDEAAVKLAFAGASGRGRKREAFVCPEFCAKGHDHE